MTNLKHNQTILVTGGAGYIGSHTIRALRSAGFEVLIVDNFSSGHRGAVEGFTVFEGDIADEAFLTEVFAKNKIAAVIHFAGSIEAGLSMTDPQAFYYNNVVGTLNLLKVMLAHNVKSIVFSSSAAVYGIPETLPISEDAAKIPVNYYGHTKLMVEEILSAYDYAYSLRSVSLRYFNAAGASAKYQIGEDHPNETHLIALALHTANGKLDKLKVFGDDFETRDGSCIRDYVHVDDLADAHVKAVEYLFAGGKTNHFNLGAETGFSVKEVVSKTKEVSGVDYGVEVCGRRAGDPHVLLADSTKAKKVLGWQPKHSDLDDIIKSAWSWHKNFPNGFVDKEKEVEES